MANVDTPFGLKPVRDAGSAPYNDGVEMFYIPASDGTALYVGDPVIRAGSGDAAGVPSATRAAATGAITGVVVGFTDPDSMERRRAQRVLRALEWLCGPYKWSHMPLHLMP